MVEPQVLGGRRFFFLGFQLVAKHRPIINYPQGPKRLTNAFFSQLLPCPPIPTPTITTFHQSSHGSKVEKKNESHGVQQPSVRQTPLREVTLMVITLLLAWALSLSVEKL